MSIRNVLCGGVLAVLAGSALADAPVAKAAIERGRYLVATSGCNDCHTPGYGEQAGKVPVADWLTGVALGFQGPWGTSYPTNLRLLVQELSEEQWMQRARAPMRPPMPWFSLRDMRDDDLRAIYRFIHGLGPSGGPAPAWVPPGQQVATPYIEFVPKNLPQQAEAR